MRKRYGTSKVHWENIEIRNTRGFGFPDCYTRIDPPMNQLDFERKNLPSTSESSKVTCRKCIYRMTQEGYDEDTDRWKVAEKAAR